MKPIKSNSGKKIQVETRDAEFCKGWENTKRNLDLLAEIENNPIARRFLNYIKIAGDAIVRRINN